MMDGYEFGYSEHAQKVWCIRKEDAPTTLCGRGVGFFPVDGIPEKPEPLCRDCLQAMWGADGSKQGPSRAVVYATCPMCQGDAPVYDGRIQGHNAWVLSAIGQPVVSDQACLGVNMAPVVVPKRGRR